MRWKGSADFFVIRADRPPAETWRTLSDTHKPLVVLEMPIPDNDLTSMHHWARHQPTYRSLAVLPTSYYYVRERHSLLEQANPYASVTDRSLWELLELSTEAANPIVWPDLSVFYPRHRAQFVPPGALINVGVAIVSGPAGLLFPPGYPAPLGRALTLRDINGPIDLMSLAIPTMSSPKPGTLRRLTGTILSRFGIPNANVDSAAPPIPPSSDDGEKSDYTLKASFPKTLAINNTLDLKLSLEWGYEHGPGERTRVALSPDGKVIASVTWSVNLQLASGEKQAAATLSVPKSATEGKSSASFAIRAMAEGPAWIRVRLYREGSNVELAFLQLNRTVVAACAEGPVSAISTTARIETADQIEDPDLTLIIDESKDRDRTHVDFRLSGGRNYPNQYLNHLIGSRDFAVSPAELFAKRFEELEKEPANTPAQIAEANLAMKELGRPLYEELLPLELRTELESIGANIRNIWIRGDGDHIPWELILLPAAECRGEGRKAEFLAQRYEVTRWIDGYRAPATVTFRDLKLVVPQYPHGRKLLRAAEESAFIKGLPFIMTTRVPAKFKNVVEVLEAGGFDVFHFLGHGQQSVQNFRRSALELEPVEETQLTSSDRQAYQPTYLKPDSCKGRKKEWRQNRPFIFLNACQSAREDAGLLEPGGWARAALTSMAGAFVGTLWSVRDETAFRFAQAFYTALLNKKTFGESSLAARRSFTNADHPSWLAYVVYAHPNTTVTQAE